MDTFVQRKDRTIRLRIKKRRTEIEQSRANKKYNPAKISKRATGLSGYHIYAPEKLSIYEIENDKEIFEATLNFIEEIKNNFCKKTTIIDFRDTKRVTAAALILIYATLETSATEGYIKSSILYPENSPATRRLLRAKNIHRLIQNQNIEYDFKSVELLPVISGVGNSHFDDIIDYIQKKIFKNNMSDQTEYYYSDAVSEAINNVGRHAYPSLPNDKRKWWLTCSVIENQLYLAIYDAGVGIPKTVIQKDWFLSSLKSSFPDEYKNLILASPELSGVKEKIMPFLPVSIAKDHQLIFLAFQGDVSGTKLDKHGQGSKSIKALVEETSTGKLWAFSGKGLYTLGNKQNLNTDGIKDGVKRLEELLPSLHILPRSFPGTLIQWNIDLT